jgi:uncharacterized coiled-coil DUF342 family protein
MAGDIKDQLKHLTVVQGSGRVADARVDDTESAKRHLERLQEEEERQRQKDKKKRAAETRKEIREVRGNLRELCKTRDELRKAGNAVRDSDMLECTKLYTRAAELIPEIDGLNKRLRTLQERLEEL